MLRGPVPQCFPLPDDDVRRLQMLKSNPFRFLATLAFSGVVVASSACSMDGTTAPAGIAPSSATLAKGGIGGGVTVVDSVQYVFTVDPTVSTTLSFGDHSLSIPAGAICSLTETYGAAHWNTSCARQTGRMTITAKVKGASNGLPRVDFEPALRFSPDRDVELSLYIKRVKQNNTVTAWKILYCAKAGNTDCIDESLPDTELSSSIINGNNGVRRRIKHFSGYLVAE